MTLTMSACCFTLWAKSLTNGDRKDEHTASQNASVWKPWKVARELRSSARRISPSMAAFYNDCWVAAEVSRCTELWRERAASPSQLAPLYSTRDHEARESAYDAALHEVEWEAKRLAPSPRTRAAAESRMIAAFARFAQNALDLHQEQIGFLTDHFLPAGIEFARRARSFDPHISRDDTIQACRNAWTACGLQPLLGAPLQVTPSILAYSLLYPYSDNYLDSADVPTKAKLSFSDRFRQRLRGHVAPPLNSHEAAVWALVAMIEQQYPRSQFPNVYACLLAIHEAQEQSIGQLRAGPGIDDARLLRVSLAKGGTSVLADACLVRGTITEAQSQAAFEWGALLQLGDDLQDVADDLHSGSQTLFTNAVKRDECLDGLVHQLLAFCDCVAAHMRLLPDGSEHLKDLLRTSWRSLILGAVASASQFFSTAFLAEAERASPFRFEFLRARQRHLAGRQGLYATLFDLFTEQPISSATSASAHKAA